MRGSQLVHSLRGTGAQWQGHMRHGVTGVDFLVQQVQNSSSGIGKTSPS